MTVVEFLDQWLVSVGPSLRPSTFASHRDLLHSHVVSRIGMERLAKLAPFTLSRVYAELLESGRRQPPAGGLSATTVLYVHRVLKHALADAVRWA